MEAHCSPSRGRPIFCDASQDRSTDLLAAHLRMHARWARLSVPVPQVVAYQPVDGLIEWRGDHETVKPKP